ncbi:MAG: hypothetical protein IJQ53_08810 [Clostridia bacterium]|nr:hypothetical protein [Clostridia bacterium]
MKNSNVKTRFRPIFWGVVFICAAALIILDAVGVNLGEGITPWRIILGVLLLGWIVYEIVQLKFASIFFPLAFLFLVFEAPLGIWLGKGEDLISTWLVLLVALLLTLGVGMLLPNRTVLNSTKRMGRTGVYLDAGKDLASALIHDNLGNVQVYITNRDAYPGNGVITVSDNLGTVTLRIPGTWMVATQISNNVGKVDVPPQDYPCSQSITLVIHDNVGTVSVVFE